MNNKEKAIRIFRIVMPIVAILSIVAIPPLDLLPPLIAPLADSVEEQVDQAIGMDWMVSLFM